MAANHKGAIELLKMVDDYSLEVVQAYMQHVQENAAECVKQVIKKLKPGAYSLPMDNGCQIKVKIIPNFSDNTVCIDFTGTSPQQDNNFNAPQAVTKAAILYVFRSLIAEDIPMNHGIFEPLEVIMPQNCLLNPEYPAAVVAGNVETSQCIVDCLYAALNFMAASQGTMNNLTFGNERYQHYETLCGGTGAGDGFNGADAVHSHMTNSRLTDPEVLEWRYPVIVEAFGIREHTGGKGKWHGGNGAYHQLRFCEPMEVSIVANRRTTQPFGLAGGGSGECGVNVYISKDGERRILNSTDSVLCDINDSILIKTPGGGGFG